MQTDAWKQELAGMLAEWHEREAAADDPTAYVRRHMSHAMGLLHDWIEDMPEPKTERGKRRREEMDHIFALLDDALDEL